VLGFCNKAGNSIRKASVTFGISTNTIMRWKQLKGSNNLEGQTVRPQRKLDLDALKGLLDRNPDLLQSEMASHFGVTENTIRSGLKKIGYKRKKNNLIQGKMRGKEADISRRKWH
jgi:transposase